MERKTLALAYFGSTIGLVGVVVLSERLMPHVGGKIVALTMGAGVMLALYLLDRGEPWWDDLVCRTFGMGMGTGAISCGILGLFLRWEIGTSSSSPWPLYGFVCVGMVLLLLGTVGLLWERYG